LKCSDQKPSSDALATDISVCIGLADALATLQTLSEDNLEPKNYLFINNKDNSS